MFRHMQPGERAEDLDVFDASQRTKIRLFDAAVVWVENQNTPFRGEQTPMDVLRSMREELSSEMKLMLFEEILKVFHDLKVSRNVAVSITDMPPPRIYKEGEA